MSLYDNQKCPVCGELFKEGDDVVTLLITEAAIKSSAPAQTKAFI